MLMVLIDLALVVIGVGTWLLYDSFVLGIVCALVILFPLLVSRFGERAIRKRDETNTS